MNKVIAGVALAAAFAVGFQPAYARMADNSPEEKQQHIQDKLDKMDDELNLTAEQEEQIRQILEQKVDGTLEKEAAHEQIRDVLTAEQQTEYDQLKEEWSKDKNKDMQHEGQYQ